MDDWTWGACILCLLSPLGVVSSQLRPSCLFCWVPDLGAMGHLGAQLEIPLSFCKAGVPPCGLENLCFCWLPPPCPLPRHCALAINIFFLGASLAHLLAASPRAWLGPLGVTETGCPGPGATRSGLPFTTPKSALSLSQAGLLLPHTPPP